jgi:ABC-2 type transport system permease protein
VPWLRPYLAAFAARFILTMQYRAAALAGFVTQCWWGGLKVMIYAAFYAAPSAASAPLSLQQVITYTWLAQATWALLPWQADPEIAGAVRTGSVAYDRLRPVDTYAWWFARACAWLVARLVPRAGLMILAAGVALPLLGLEEWGWAPPATLEAAALFALSLTLGALLAAAITMLINVCVTATLTDRGINAMASSVVIIFSGNLLPLSLFPDGMATVLLVQPFASLIDIPFRIYFGALAGTEAAAAIGLQVFWLLVTVAVGHAWLTGAMRKLQAQGG